MLAEAQRKLFDFADSIEVWRHIGELLKEEFRRSLRRRGRSPIHSTRI